jgi:sucrose-6-phosphate hydrolase SacC (GH32 family)
MNPAKQAPDRLEIMRTAPLDDRRGRPRPVLHFAPARKWMNDPNGLVQ